MLTERNGQNVVFLTFDSEKVVSFKSGSKKLYERVVAFSTAYKGHPRNILA